jgi:hypothetical protein
MNTQEKVELLVKIERLIDAMADASYSDTSWSHEDHKVVSLLLNHVWWLNDTIAAIRSEQNVHVNN